jgi:hypothetical protein
MTQSSSTTTAASRVFVSYNRRDRDDVECIAKSLDDAGIAVWLDRWSLAPGDLWQDAIESALQACDACAVFVGRHETGPWQHTEMRAAIDRRVIQPGYRVIPVFLPGAPEKPDGLSAFLLAGQGVRFTSLDDWEAIRLLISGINGIAPGPPSRTIPRAVVEVVITGSVQEGELPRFEFHAQRR